MPSPKPLPQSDPTHLSTSHIPKPSPADAPAAASTTSSQTPLTSGYHQINSPCYTPDAPANFQTPHKPVPKYAAANPAPSWRASDPQTPALFSLRSRPFSPPLP